MDKTNEVLNESQIIVFNWFILDILFFDDYIKSYTELTNSDEKVPIEVMKAWGSLKNGERTTVINQVNIRLLT